MNKSAELYYTTKQAPLCPYCGESAKLEDSSRIYGTSFGDMWICSCYPGCDSYVGIHKHGVYQNCPLGVLANADHREAKKLAHDKFDILWKSRIMTRGQAYVWLQLQMDKKEPDAHIGEMTFEECLKVYEKVETYLQSIYSKNDG